MEPQKIFEQAAVLLTQNSDPDAIFHEFKVACETAYWELLREAARRVEKNKNPIDFIPCAPWVIPVIQSDGYKKWIANPNFMETLAASEVRAMDIYEDTTRRFAEVSRILLDYLRFIIKTNSFFKMQARPFERIEDVYNFLVKTATDRGLTYAIDNSFFPDWLDEFFEYLDLTDLVIPKQEPTKTLVIDSYPTFDAAAKAARLFAIKNNTEVILERNELTWAISHEKPITPSQKYCELKYTEEYEPDYFEPLEIFFNNETEGKNEYLEEIQYNNEGWTNSITSGWYYSDDG